MIITGHTKGIGKHLLEQFPGSVGCSRSNGWDIADTKALVTLAADHDVFINCAHGKGFQQAQLMMDLFEEYRYSNKTFINIGTDAAYPSKWAVVYEQYPIEKSALVAACEHMQNLPHSCCVTLLEPNDVRQFDLLNLSDAVRFILANPGVEIKNIRMQGRSAT